MLGIGATALVRASGRRARLYNAWDADATLLRYAWLAICLANTLLLWDHLRQQLLRGKLQFSRAVCPSLIMWGCARVYCMHMRVWARARAVIRKTSRSLRARRDMDMDIKPRTRGDYVLHSRSRLRNSLLSRSRAEALFPTRLPSIYPCHSWRAFKTPLAHVRKTLRSFTAVFF